MKIFTILIAVILTSGCVYQIVTEKDIKLGTLYCADLGGLSRISESFRGETQFLCYNSKRYISEERAAKYLVLNKTKSR